MARQRRWSERESGVRRHYRDWLLPLLNNCEDPSRFGQMVEWDPDTRTTRPKEDPRFPLFNVVDAIKDVVAGEEDCDRERYERGASLLLDLANAHPIQYMPALRERLDPSLNGKDLVRAFDARTGEPMIELFFEQVTGEPLAELWERWGLRIGSDERNGSILFLSVFSHYLQEHRRFMQLGVCHDYVCNRLYVKTKGKPHQIYCTSRCRERMRYERSKQAAKKRDHSGT